jgi:tRNA U34 2-thiouridine synthase MnmA/TrmU
MATAISLISGGLDSILATKLIIEQNIEIIGLTFKLPFLTSDSNAYIKENICDPYKIKYIFTDLSKSKKYYNLIKNPKFGYGKNLNPCIDCHLLMLKLAKNVMKEQGADFIITGDVLGERPMSQRKSILKIIDREAGLTGKVLRPLSAKCLDITEPEKKGLVAREGLLAICGRSRKEQLRLAKKYKLRDYATPAGGCLLTEKDYCRKVKDLIKYDQLSSKHVSLLRVGRHFRLSEKAKLIVGRNEIENETLKEIWKAPDIYFESRSITGPSAILIGKADPKLIKKSAAIIASYTKAKANVTFEVLTRKKGLPKLIDIKPLSKKTVSAMRI